MEILEKRLAPAGIVTAVVAGGVLKLTGDGLDNQLVVKVWDTDRVQVTGLYGTQIVLQSGSPLSQISPGGVKSLLVDMKDGNDSVRLEDMTLEGNITVHLGAGINDLTIEEIDLPGNLSVTGGGGSDTVQVDVDHMYGPGRIRIDGTTTLALGDGDNLVGLYASDDEMSFLGAVSYTGGAGKDQFLMGAETLFLGAGLNLKMGAGAAEAHFTGRDFRVEGSVAYLSGDHGDQKSSFRMEGGRFMIAGGLTIKHGAGLNDTVFQLGAALNVLGGVSIVNGNTPGASYTYFDAPVVTIGGGLTISSGTGEHANEFRGLIDIGGSLAITNGAGSGMTSFGGTTPEFTASLAVGGDLAITNKAGVFTTFFNDIEVYIGGKMVINNAGTGTQPTGSTVDTLLQTRVLEVDSISVINGKGNFNTTLWSSAGHTGAVSITNGGTTPALEEISAGLTSTTIAGNWHITGNVTVMNGNGIFSTWLGDPFSEPLESMVVGGSVSFTTGNSDQFIQNAIAVNEFTARSVTIKNGNAATILNSIEAEDLRVKGALSITSGNVTAESGEGIENTIYANVGVELGSLAIKNGNGYSEFMVSAPTVAIRGGFSLVGGTAAFTLVSMQTAGRLSIGGAASLTTSGGDVGIDIEAPDLHFGGRVTLSLGGAGAQGAGIGRTAEQLFVGGGLVVKTGGAGEVRIGGEDTEALTVVGGVNYSTTGTGGAKALRIQGDGMITGGVSASFGGGESGAVSLSGLGDFQGLLRVAGGISMSGAAGVNRGLHMFDTSVAALTLTGGSGVEDISLRSVEVRGNVLLNLKGGNDQVALDAVLIRGATTIDTGDGADSIGIEAGEWLAPSVFHGAVKVLMGAGNDDLKIAPGESGGVKATFLRAASFDGGAPAGDNTYTRGQIVTFEVYPTITHFPMS